MSGSFRIATIRGIDIKVHWTFGLILLYGAFTWSQLAGTINPDDPQSAVTGGLYGVVLMLFLFLLVVLHELGHSLAAIRYKIEVADIILMPLGGVARIKQIPEDPKQELVIAVAGPAVNFLLALLMIPVLLGLLAVQAVGDSGFAFDPTSLSVSGFLSYLLLSNLILGAFNLIPAFPMDGGRILRAILALFFDYQAATRTAVLIGQGLAVILGTIGLFWQPANLWLVLIAIFIYFGANQEGQEVMVRSALREVCVGDAYNKQATVLGAGQRVSEIVDLMLTSYQPDFAVMVGSQVVGVVTREKVVQALRQSQEDAPASQIMAREFLRVAPDTSLYDVRKKMAERGATVAAVYQGPTYLGLISLADISEAFLLLAASPTERGRPSADTRSQEQEHGAKP